MADLDPRLTFETFVVGPANRLASAAARRAADSPGESYNPLFIYSASGLGKSHLLCAIAHLAARVHDKRKVLYQTLERYLEELADALEAGEQEALRERYRALDLLLMDDVQFLAGQPQAQEMLLSTLDALSGAGNQIALASDRPPAEIDGLDARLVSRFSGGLIVDIAPPEYETRVAILRKRAEEEGHALEPGVAEALAKYPSRNIRELGGALNRVLAVQDLEGRAVTPGDVPALMGQVAEEEEAEGDDFGTFLDEVSDELESAVKSREEPWRKGLREAADAAEREGFSARRLRKPLEREEPPAEWEKLLEDFKAQLARLRRIESELEDLDNPWPEAAQGVVRDPDRLEEAEALLASVRERQRPFRTLGRGPKLDDLEGKVPQLALRAARQLITEERPKYNPLYLWGSDPATARAVLGATGRSWRAERPQARMAVVSVSAFAEDFIRALSDGVAGAWRERWWTLDLLLVHGVEELSATERAQDEFFHLFEALKRRGSRILLVADRPASGLEGVDERLRSRFEGGLVLEVAAAGLPAGADDLTLVDPGEEPAEAVEAEGPAPEVPVGPEGARPTGAAAGAGPGASPAAPAARAAGPVSRPPEEPLSTPEDDSAHVGGELRRSGGWFPSPEKVVWNWPRLADRIIEDLE